MDCFRPSRSETECFYSSKYEGSYIAGPLRTCVSHWSSRRKHPFSETSLWKFRWTVPIVVKVKVKWSRYRPGVAQRVGRGIALLFHNRGTRRGWVVSTTPRRHFTPGETRYPFYRRLGGPQGRSGQTENLVPTGIRSRTVQPVASRYTDWATGPTPIVVVVFIITHRRQQRLYFYKTWYLCLFIWVYPLKSRVFLMLWLVRVLCYYLLNPAKCT